jgi:hypothetical protein
VFPVRYELNSYMSCGSNSVFKGLKLHCIHTKFHEDWYRCSCIKVFLQQIERLQSWCY